MSITSKITTQNDIVYNFNGNPNHMVPTQHITIILLFLSHDEVKN